MKLKRFGDFKKIKENNEFQEDDMELNDVPGRAPSIDDMEMKGSIGSDIEDSYEEEEEGYDKFSKLKGREQSSFQANGESYQVGDMICLNVRNKEAVFEIVAITDSEIETICRVPADRLVSDKDYMFFISDLEDGKSVTAYHSFASETNKWMKKVPMGTIESIKKK